MKNRLSSDDLQTLTHSVITSKLDYCNVILFGLNQNLMAKLQKVQNAAARLICKLLKRSSISEVIQKLHWLQVEQRCIYKILLIVYKHFSSTSPSFLSSLLEITSSETRELKHTYYDTQYGRRAFRYTAPRLWNKLPLEVRTEKSIKKIQKKAENICFHTHWRYHA